MNSSGCLGMDFQLEAQYSCKIMTMSFCKTDFFYFVFKCLLPTRMHAYPLYVLFPSRSEEAAKSPVTKGMNGCELPCGCWEPNFGSLKKFYKFF